MPEVSISEHARKTRHPGRLFLVTAPSGAGKSSLVNALLARQPNIKLSISNTTRDPRPGEVNGREYHFVTEDMFLEMKSRGEFLESAYVHGHYYGTSRPWIESQMARGNDVLLEIDWQGARQVREKFEGTVGIFILPPSIEALEWRLHHRGTDSPQTIEPAALQTSSILLKNFFYWERILTIEERSSFSAQDKNGPHYC